jgi:hypothetical protein
MIETVITSLVVAAITSIATYVIQERKLKAEFRTEFMAEQAAKKLLESPKWEKRSFDEIKKRLAGFDDNELRKILVRSGAVRFEGENSKELWGLISKNEGSL